MKLKGQFTVFLAMIFLVMLTFVFSLIESARIECIKTNQKTAQMAASENLLAEFNIPLKNRYQIFAIDGNGRNLQQVLFDDISENSGTGMFSGSVENVVISKLFSIADIENSPLKKEILQYMKNIGLIDQAKDLYDQLRQQGIFQSNMKNAQLSGQLNQAKEQSKQQELRYQQNDKKKGGLPDGKTDQKEVVTVKDPRETLSALLNNGLLSLVLPENFEISEREMLHPGNSGQMIQSLNNFFSIQTAAAQFNQMENFYQNFTELNVEKSVIALYIQKYFKEALMSGSIHDDTTLSYEIEYLICGHPNDSDNLRDIVNRLVLMRTIFDVAYLFTDTLKMQSIHSVAASVTSAAGMPFLEPVAYVLMMLAWAYGESIMDVRALMTGNRVPLFKNESTWQLSLERILNISRQTVQQSEPACDEGLNYQQYLFFFLLFTQDGEVLERMIRLMQENIRMEKGYETFSMQDCYYGMTGIASFEISGLFIGRPKGIQNIQHYFQWSCCY